MAEQLDKTTREMENAIRKGDVAEIQKTIAQGVSPNSQDALKWTPLHRAIEKRRYDVAIALLDAGANPNTRNEPWKNSPLHDLVKRWIDGDELDHVIHLASRLIAAGADPNASNGHGDTPLHVVGSEAMARLLLAQGADVNRQNLRGESAFERLKRPSENYKTREFQNLVREVEARSPSSEWSR